ncbi:hypothetical protein BT96DRAFT_1005869 [Gymnopus androsaceus JB14]|uniref:Tyrosine specific protein phosphatases domain-containing protein n=1 Tax=Gymnopus androsaceus JB14 TaxID=1447944 RepID=A0A6A4GM65_9AGAR|nr:hypothetical protein BT96DRAFT_1005869 [Gymnopus androsaceus JB14]
MAVIRILGKNAMGPRLVGLGKDSLQFCQNEILQAWDVYLDPQAYPILIHCTRGKDRSGLVIIIVLFILRVPVDRVKADYIWSGQGLDRVRESMMDEVREIGMDEKYTLAPGDVVDEVLKEGGGVDLDLDAIGFGESKRQTLRVVIGVTRSYIIR